MQFEIVDIGNVEQPDQIDRVVLEDIWLGKRDAPPILDEFHRAGNLAHTVGEAAENAGKTRHILRLPVFQCGADDARQIADILRHEKIVLHETLDGGKAGARLIIQGISNLTLDVEGKALFRLAGDEMHLATHSPEKIIGLFEQPEFRPRQDAELDQIGRIADVVIIFGDPEQRVQVAQPALAFLDVRLHQITRIASLAVALVALGELGGDEFRAGAGDDF